ncbi:hypothetical protein JTF04_11560 [Mammaliicoccus vitulinus]|uniref:hypothetical protein n=1 Tax=Mammaliicoccus vitulinus TaxID=71237 RepID=UPI00194F6010|nr:hypothetical protein [Mammaliicoccus vitulinus]MBM6630323.1 hypothetical protein [Mammaliicoccus vitulinus]
MKDVIYITAIFTLICSVSVFLSWVTPMNYWSYVFILTISWYVLETVKKYILNR